MPKLLLSIFAIFLISVGLLQLRQQRLNYRFEINRLHDKIESSQSQLWNQQLKIAGRTNPEAMVRRVQRNAPSAAPANLASSPAAAASASENTDQVSAQSTSPTSPTSNPSSADRRWLDSRVVP